MSNYRGSIQNRIGRPYKVEYVNRAGERVNPMTGKPIHKSNLANKPYTRPVSKENGLSTAKRRKLPIKKTGALFGPLKPIPTDPTIDPPPHMCFNCWQPGHKKTNCLRPAVNRFCNNCGRRNADMSSCPRCREAYKLWQEVIHNKGSAEEMNEQAYMEDDDNEIEEVNDPDELLQELIYQDQKTREYLENQQRQKEQRKAHNSIHKNNAALQEQRAFADSRDVYIEHVNEPYGNERKSYVHEREPRGQTREMYARDQFLEHDPLIDGDLYLNNQESHHDKHSFSQQERHIGMAVFKEREVYGQEVEAEPNSTYQRYLDNLYCNREERVKTPDPPKIEGNWRKAVADASSVSNNSDPVQDILLLAKTISHLSSETQDLIMRQVIAERQEQTRRRAAAQECSDDPW